MSATIVAPQPAGMAPPPAASPSPRRLHRCCRHADRCWLAWAGQHGASGGSPPRCSRHELGRWAAVHLWSATQYACPSATVGSDARHDLAPGIGDSARVDAGTPCTRDQWEKCSLAGHDRRIRRSGQWRARRSRRQRRSWCPGHFQAARSYGRRVTAWRPGGIGSMKHHAPRALPASTDRSRWS